MTNYQPAPTKTGPFKPKKSQSVIASILLFAASLILVLVFLSFSTASSAVLVSVGALWAILAASYFAILSLRE